MRSEALTCRGAEPAPATTAVGLIATVLVLCMAAVMATVPTAGSNAHRVPCDSFRRSARGRQETHGLSTQRHASEAVRHVRAGINIDAVRQHFRSFRRCMPVHHDLAEIGSTVEERPADPQEIVRTLVLQRYTGTNS